jgi:phosphomannomutase
VPALGVSVEGYSELPPKFGTSGLRGLVVELTDALCARYAQAFLAVCGSGDAVLIGRDLRPSSARIAAAVAAGASAAGYRVICCGEVPTPALALAALGRGAPSVMVTGSHIPADRNGLKFYSAKGEITKAEEAKISRIAGDGRPLKTREEVGAEQDGAINERYLRRYIEALPKGALRGMRLGVYEHSSVARDVLGAVLRGLGAEVVALGRSDSFVPVDTEAVAAETRKRLRDWVAEHGLDAVLSADGDGDRPLLTDERGAVIPGDVLGMLTALALGADCVITPVSSNTMIEASGAFDRVIRTRIGSPFVIAAMAAAAPPCRPVGFEANGGFLLGFDAALEAGVLARLMTRDSLLPLLMPLVLARRRGLTLGGLWASLPARHTASDRLENIATERSLALVSALSGSQSERAGFFAGFGPEAVVDRTDGLRVTFADGRILHLRPSGNAPELRCYAEAESSAAAEAALAEGLRRLRARFA